MRRFSNKQKQAVELVQDSTGDADHIVPYATGGETKVENCQMLEPERKNMEQKLKGGEGFDASHCSSASVVSFGKHKGQTIERMVRDKNYVSWLLKQSWFRQHNIYQAVVDEINRRYETTIGIPEVYFVINEQMTRLKVGTSVNPPKRLQSIQTGNADTLVIYGTVLGDRHFEKQLHKEFAEHRLNGEWFVFADCKCRVDEILGKDRAVHPSKKYSLWEFRLITGLTEDQVKYAEWAGSQAGIGSWGVSGFWDEPENDDNPLLDDSGNIRGWVWCKIVDSGCLRERSD